MRSTDPARDDLLHALEGRASLPDAGEGACCIGAAAVGPAYCTCWERDHDLDQQPPQLDLEPTTRDRMCGDCAFRPGSPERLGIEEAASDGQDVERLGSDPSLTFWCHQGMRRVVGQTHPAGVRVGYPDPHRLAYDPPIVSGVPYKADGTPGERCAGQAAMLRTAEKRAAQ